MLKTYELANRHFGWQRPPKGASESEILTDLRERSMRSQGIVSLDSICYADPRRKAGMSRLIEIGVRRKALVGLELGGSTLEHWARPEALEASLDSERQTVHILSPFDPLIHQRKRLQLFFGYEHRFEAYPPKAQRRFGYFAQAVLIGDAIVAAIDLKTDREQQKLRMSYQSRTINASPHDGQWVEPPLSSCTLPV